MIDIKVECLVSARLPTEDGEYQLSLYTDNISQKEHLALSMGELSGRRDVLVRVHSECFTGDVLGSLRCDCGEQLQTSIKMIASAGEGLLLYLRQEGRGIGLESKLHAYNLQDQGYDTVDANLLLGHQADERDYTVAAHIIREIDVGSIRLITNNPEKIEALQSLGVTVTGSVRLSPTVNPENARYLQTKKRRMNHLLNLNFSAHLDDRENGSG